MTSLLSQDVVLTLQRRHYYVMCSVGLMAVVLYQTAAKFIYFKAEQYIFHCLLCSPLQVKCDIQLSTHWGRATHICVSNLTIIGSDNGLSPRRHQAIFCTSAGLLLIGPLGTNINAILFEIVKYRAVPGLHMEGYHLYAACHCGILMEQYVF